MFREQLQVPQTWDCGSEPRFLPLRSRRGGSRWSIDLFRVRENSWWPAVTPLLLTSPELRTSGLWSLSQATVVLFIFYSLSHM